MFEVPGSQGTPISDLKKDKSPDSKDIVPTDATDTSSPAATTSTAAPAAGNGSDEGKENGDGNGQKGETQEGGYGEKKEGYVSMSDFVKGFVREHLDGHDNTEIAMSKSTEVELYKLFCTYDIIQEN